MNQNISLTPGYIICPKCNGDCYRFVVIKNGFKDNKRKAFCNKCGGTGKIDWVQNITGQDSPNKIIPGFSNMEIVWGSSNESADNLEAFSIEICDPKEIEEIYHKISENLNR